MNTHKIFTLAALLALALGSVAMAENVILSGDDHREKGVGNSIAEAVSDAQTKGYEIADGASFAIWANTSESTFTNINRCNISVSGQTSTAPVISGSTKRLFKSVNEDGGAEAKTLFFQNLVFKGNSTENNNGGGAIWLSGDNFTITAKTITFQENTVTTAEKGGALSLSGKTVFTGSDSKITFTGNKADGKANDIYATGSLTFQETGIYSFDGGITGDVALNINTGATVSFLSGVSNKFSSLSISGTETKASFASGTTTQTGATTIQDTTAGNVTFDGTQTFTGDVTVSNGGNATFGSDSESTGALLTITDNTSKVAFEGTQQFTTNVLIKNWASAEVNAGATFKNTPIVVDNRGELTINEAFNTPTNKTSSLEVKQGGVANLSSSSDFTFNGNLKVNGGTVNFTDNTDGKLTISGTLSGNNGNLNLAIIKSTEKTFAGLIYHEVGGQTLNVNTLSLSDGNEFIKVLNSDFSYHEESVMVEETPFLTLETGTMTLAEFNNAFELPFSWFASPTYIEDPANYPFRIIDMDWTTSSNKFWIYKVDGDKVPEPSTCALFILGSIGLYFIRRKKVTK